MKIAFQMEPMDEPKPGDSHTLTLMHEATKRGYDVFHYTPDTLSLDQTGQVSAYIAPVRVDLDKDEHYALGEYSRQDLSDFDVIMFRQDPPYDIAYVTNTVILERLKKEGVLFVNDPFWIRNMPDKLSIFDFAEYLPPTLVSRNLEEVGAFYEEHQDVIIKPLHSFHGHGIRRSQNIGDAKKTLSEYDEQLMFQPFLKEVLEGNKRVVFYDGEIAGILNSIPDDKEFRIFRGSTDVAAELTPREREICEKIGAVLKERGMLFVGIDFIGEYLTEINAGSVGSIFRLDEVYDDNFSAKLFDLVELKIASKNQ